MQTPVRRVTSRQKRKKPQKRGVFVSRRSPSTTTGRSWFSTHAAETRRDVGLAYHYDDAEVTLNVNLGGAFEGGELLFGGSGGGRESGGRAA